MDKFTLVGACTGIGFCIAAWTYPLVKPVLDRMLDTEYTCEVQYLLGDGTYQERSKESLRSELRVGKFVSGFKITQVIFVEDKLFGSAEHPEYKFIQLICTKK